MSSGHWRELSKWRLLLAPDDVLGPAACGSRLVLGETGGFVHRGQLRHGVGVTVRASFGPVDRSIYQTPLMLQSAGCTARAHATRLRRMNPLGSARVQHVQLQRGLWNKGCGRTCGGPPEQNEGPGFPRAFDFVYVLLGGGGKI